MRQNSQKQSELVHQFILFAMVGVVGTLAHYSTMILLVEVFGNNPLYAAMAGFLVGAVVNYLLNYKYTFKSTKKHTEVFHKFLFIAATGAGLNYVLMYIGIEFLEIQYIVSQLFATAIILVWNFVGNKIWSFSEKPVNLKS